MDSSTADRFPPKTMARIAGALYLCMAGLGLFAMSATSGTVQAGNASGLVRLGLVSDVLSSLAFLFTAMALYVLLRHVHSLAAAAMVVFVIVGVTIGFANLTNQYGQVALAAGSASNAFGGEASASFITLFSSLQAFGTAVTEIFWGLWLLPLAYLVWKSGYFPSLLAALLGVAGLSWLLQSGIYFEGIDLGGFKTVLTAGTIGEFTFMAYLVARGVRTQPRNVGVTAMPPHFEPNA